MNRKMNELFKNKGLTLKMEELEKQIVVFWEGRSTERDPSIFLMPIFNDLLNHHKKIILNFKDLEFMNSSTITPLLKLMDRIQNTTDEVLIIYSIEKKWQELSFSALEIFKTNDHRIDIIGEE
jgi:hypothetical protein